MGVDVLFRATKTAKKSRKNETGLGADWRTKESVVASAFGGTKGASRANPTQGAGSDDERGGVSTDDEGGKEERPLGNASEVRSSSHGIRHQLMLRLTGTLLPNRDGCSPPSLKPRRFPTSSNLARCPKRSKI